MKQILPFAFAALLCLISKSAAAQGAGITLGANFGSGFVNANQEVYLGNDLAKMRMDVSMIFGAQIEFRFNGNISLVLNPSFKRTKFSARETIFGDFFLYESTNDALMLPVMFRLSSQGEIRYFGNIGIVQSIQITNDEQYFINGVESENTDYYGIEFLRTGLAIGGGIQFDLGEGLWASGEVRDYFVFESPGDIFTFQGNGTDQSENSLFLLIGFHYMFGG